MGLCANASTCEQTVELGRELSINYQLAACARSIQL